MIEETWFNQRPSHNPVNPDRQAYLDQAQELWRERDNLINIGAQAGWTNYDDIQDLEEQACALQALADKLWEDDNARNR